MIIKDIKLTLSSKDSRNDDSELLTMVAPN